MLSKLACKPSPAELVNKRANKIYQHAPAMTARSHWRQSHMPTWNCADYTPTLTECCMHQFLLNLNNETNVTFNQTLTLVLFYFFSGISSWERYGKGEDCQGLTRRRDVAGHHLHHLVSSYTHLLIKYCHYQKPTIWSTLHLTTWTIWGKVYCLFHFMVLRSIHTIFFFLHWIALPHCTWAISRATMN